MKYIITYSEMLARSFIVEASSEEEAEQKVLDAVECGHFALTMNDYFPDSSMVQFDDIYHDGDEEYFQSFNELID